MREINVATEFSPYLGGRYRRDGPYSGEQFRDDYLRPALEDVVQSGDQLQINFDGVAGMPSSFLEEAFGGLLRVIPQLTADRLMRSLRLEASDPEMFPFLRLAEDFIRREAARR